MTEKDTHIDRNNWRYFGRRGMREEIVAHLQSRIDTLEAEEKDLRRDGLAKLANGVRGRATALRSFMMAMPDADDSGGAHV